jgi:hypothetical protein
MDQSTSNIKALLKFGLYKIGAPINAFFKVLKILSQMGVHLKSTSFFFSSNKEVTTLAYPFT